MTLNALDAHAVRASVREPDPAALLPVGGTGDLVLPAGLIDQCGPIAVFGLVQDQWTEDEVLLAFPTRLACVEFTPRRDRSALLRAVVRMRVEGSKLLSAVEFLDTAGRVVLRVLGREEEINRLPADLYAYWSAPRRHHLSRDLSTVFAGVPGVDAYTIREVGNIGNKLLVQRLWSQVVARMVLSAPELRVFTESELPPTSVASRLLGRVAAKDAIRVRMGLDICQADLELYANRYGQPLARVPSGRAPFVSLAHKHFAAVAVAADPDRCTGVGIDLEPLGTLDAHLRADAFTPDECQRLENAARATNDTADAWYLSAWTAKEAVGKALGRGVLGGPRALEVVEIDPHTGRLSLVLHGAMAAAFPERARKRIAAYRRVHGGYVLALCLLPRELIF